MTDVHADLQRARTTLVEAELAEFPHERFLAAHTVALRTAAVVLACRARPGSQPSGRPRNAWRVLADVAPELAEWAAFFAATQAQRDAVAAGFSAGVTVRQADDLLRDAAAFLAVVQRRLDTRRRPAPTTSSPTSTLMSTPTSVPTSTRQPARIAADLTAEPTAGSAVTASHRRVEASVR